MAGHRWRGRPNLLLRLYGESRGAPRSTGGAANLELDRWVQLNERARACQAVVWRTGSNLPDYLDAFARGINDYGRAIPTPSIPTMRVVLPVSGVDVVGHPLRAVHYRLHGVAADGCA